MAQHVDNIGEPGARRRRRGGLVWVAITGIVAILIITTNAPKPTRLLLAIPVGMAALGFLQAREKTWVVLAALGKREVYEIGGNRDLSSFERMRVRRQALGVVVRAAMIAALATVIAWVV